MGYSNITIQYYLGICLTFLSTRAFRVLKFRILKNRLILKSAP